MQISEVHQVKEAHNPQDANKLLSQGWKLIAVVAVSSQAVQGALIACYVLGIPDPAR